MAVDVPLSGPRFPSFSREPVRPYHLAYRTAAGGPSVEAVAREQVLALQQGAGP